MKKFVQSAFVFFLMLITVANAYSQTNVVPDNVELQALKDLYDSLGGINWTTKTNWPTPGNWPSTATAAQMGTWYGVTVANNDVTAISLATNNLFGKLPSSISQLTGLTELTLSNNRVKNIPASLGTLINLKTLLMNNNFITGIIPASLSVLVNLETLDLNTNSISGVIPDLSNLTKLKTLGLHRNTPLAPGTIPSWIQYLTQLSYLNLQFTNRNGSIPGFIGNLINLKTLGLHDNQLTGPIPAELGNLANLTSLILLNNKLTGSIPASLGNLKKLVGFSLANNQLSGSLADALTGMGTVATFDISNNKLTGTFPTTMSQMTGLTNLYAGNNQFSGTVPTILAHMNKLFYLDLNNNQFNGVLPSDFAQSSLFQYLNFDNNELTSIPNFGVQSNRGNLTLTLSNNHLDFSQLEPLIGAGIKTLTYAPQKNINDITKVNLVYGGPLIINTRPQGQFSNTTIWEKQQYDGTWAPVNTINQDATQQTYNRTISAITDEGVYHWKMTNTKVTGLTLQSSPITVKTATRFTIDQWGFQYKYDARRRMIAKKLPGADWVYVVYDNRDRLVMTQDGEQRKLNNWSFTKYDVLNRPVMTGIYTHTVPLDQAGMNALISTTNFYETYNGDVTNHGYTNTVFSASNFAVANFEALTITYYDNYNFKQMLNGSEYNYNAGELDGQDPSEFHNTVGLITGTKTKVLYGNRYSVSRWDESVSYYDNKYRIIQTVTDNETGGIDRTTNVYDFVGKVLKTKTTDYAKSYVHWQNMNGVVVDGLTIYRNIAGSGAGMGASSVEVLPASTDGWFEFTQTNANTSVIGFSDFDADKLYSTIDYALYLANTYYSAYVNGTFKQIVGSLKVGDVIRLERVGTTIRVKRNGVFEFGFTTPSTTSLLIDASFLGGSSGFTYVHASFAGNQNSIVRTFDYDHAGRLLKTWHSVNGATPVLLASNEYNELGQLVDKKLYNTDPATASDDQRTFKQSVDYRYNIRGWLNSVNDVNTPEASDLFSMNLNYNTPTGGTAQYNGNISEILWRGPDTKTNSYGYSYDPMNRLVEAKYYNAADPTRNGRFNEKIWDEDNNQSGYDLNGNINFLSRSGKTGVDGIGRTTYGPMDNLSYQYLGNQLLKVSDNSVTTEGFIDGINVDNDYAYDANGNMNLDKNKSITGVTTATGNSNITYNYLNLPDKVVKSTGDYIKYTYDAAGRKLKQEVYSPTNVLKKKTDYAGEFFYENDTLKFINHEEGRIIPGSELTANYSLDGNLTDQSGHSPNGVLTGGGTLVNDRFNNLGAWQMDGVDDYGQIPDDEAFEFGSGDFTVSYWVKKLTSTTSWNNIQGINKWNTGASPGTNSWGLSCGNYNSNIPLLCVESGTTLYQVNAATALLVNVWYNVVGVREGGKIKIYVNGQLEGTTTVGTISLNNTTVPLYIGRIPSGSYTNAVFDDLKIIKKALSKEEISKLINNTYQISNEYQYHLKDHLGNVRVTFTTKDDQEQNVATVETANLPTERSKFLNIDKARRINSALFDHTYDNQPRPTEGAFAVRLSGTSSDGYTREKYGLARSLSVMPGDKIQLEVYAKYVDLSNNGVDAAIRNLVAHIAANAADPGTIVDGTSYATNSASNFSYGGYLDKSSEVQGSPKAYLNYLVFDKDYNFIPSKSGYKRVTTNAQENTSTIGDITTAEGKPHELLSASVDITEAGFVYIYLSNEEETPLEVYFDDFKVTQVKSPVIASDDYYPFGLTFNSYQREKSVKNDIKFNNREFQDELDFNLYDYKKRFYDPALCRFISIDPLADHFPWWTSYQFAGLMPTKYVDLDGMEPAYAIPGSNYIVPASDQIRHTPPPNAQALNEASADKINQSAESSKTAVSFMPIVGDGIDAADAVNDFKQGNYGMAALSAASLIPFADVVTKPLKAVLKHSDEVVSITKKIENPIPKPPRGKGSVPPGKRDRKRAYTKEQKQEMLDRQEGNCAQCGESKTIDEVDGHHVDRHADGGQTTTENGASVCKECHKDLHRKGNE